jgi:predicted O-linked N-acetylglucosamine transferase (SPINDLY family)
LEQAQLDDAIASYRRAIQCEPANALAYSNLLYTLYFCPGYDSAAILAEHRRWNERFSAPLAKSIQPHTNDRSPDRRLRIGYVSPHFRSHCQSFFTTPLFTAHDRPEFEIICYSDVVCPDAMTERLRSLVAGWRNIAGNRRAGRCANLPGSDRHPGGPDDAHERRPAATLCA